MLIVLILLAIIFITAGSMLYLFIQLPRIDALSGEIDALSGEVEYWKAQALQYQENTEKFLGELNKSESNILETYDQEWKD